jgi:hypothetical protein
MDFGEVPSYTTVTLELRMLLSCPCPDTLRWTFIETTAFRISRHSAKHSVERRQRVKKIERLQTVLQLVALPCSPKLRGKVRGKKLLSQPNILVTY